MVCTIIKSKFMTTRSNTMMAFTSVEDLSGTMEILVFPKVLANCREALKENAVVVITGRVSVKEEEAAKLVAETIEDVEDYSPTAGLTGAPAAARSKAQKGLYLKLPDRTGKAFKKVENLLTLFEGGLPVYMFFEDIQKLTLAPKNLWTLDHPLLQKELARILGENNVVFK